VGEKTQVVEMPHCLAIKGHLLTTAFTLRNNFPENGLRVHCRKWPGLARGLLYGLRCRVRPKTRLGESTQTDVLTTQGAIMTWTKPEAEIVAVTMEVTAYVATL
jgi:coenzyme PQQ precursor peptide PqqA